MSSELDQTNNSEFAAPRRAVIVDDEHFVREALRLILKEKNFIVVGEAGDGHRALEVLQANKPDFLFLDIKMPGPDGIEVLQQAKQINPNITVIMISGNATKETVQLVAKLGANGFVVKPFNPNSVFKVLDRLQ